MHSAELIARYRVSVEIESVILDLYDFAGTRFKRITKIEGREFTERGRDVCVLRRRVKK